MKNNNDNFILLPGSLDYYERALCRINLQIMLCCATLMAANDIDATFVAQLIANMESEIDNGKAVAMDNTAAFARVFVGMTCGIKCYMLNQLIKRREEIKDNIDWDEKWQANKTAGIAR